MQAVEEVKTKTSIIDNIPLKVTTPQEYEKGAETLKQLRKLLKFIDEKEKEVTRPILEGLNKARALFKPYKIKCTQTIAILNANLSKFKRKQEEEARKKQEEIDKQVSEDDIFKPVIEPKIPKTDLKTRKIWRFKVIDKSKINPKFLIPDEKAINELVRKLHEKAEDIVGEGSIRIYTEEVNY